MRQLVLFNFSFIRQYKHICRSRGLPQCLAQKPHQHFDSTSFRLCLCPRVGSQPIHTTSKFKLDSVASELVEYRSMLRNVMTLPLSHICPTDMIDLCSPASFGAT